MKRISKLILFLSLVIISKGYSQVLSKEPSIIEDSSKGSLESKVENLDRKKMSKRKKFCQIISTYGKEVEIDRGWLHKLNKHDIYGVYNLSYELKGKIEVDSIGFDRSTGTIYAKNKEDIKPGDTAVYLGQRKRFGVGFMSWSSPAQIKELNLGMVNPWDNDSKFYVYLFPPDISYTFKNGLSLIYSPGYVNKLAINENYTNTIYYSLSYENTLTIKKNLFYPSWISPTYGLSIGKFHNSFTNYNTGSSATNDGIIFSPVVGIELFSFLNFNAQYIYSPELKDNRTGEEHTFRNFLTSFVIMSRF